MIAQKTKITIAILAGLVYNTKMEAGKWEQQFLKASWLKILHHLQKE